MYTLTQARSIPSEGCKDSLADVPDPGHFCTRIVIFACLEVERAGREHFFFDSYFGDAHVDDSRVSREKTKTLQITWHDRIRCDAMQHDLTRRVTRVLSGKPRSRIHVPMSEFFFCLLFILPGPDPFVAVVVVGFEVPICYPPPLRKPHRIVLGLLLFSSYFFSVPSIGSSLSLFTINIQLVPLSLYIYIKTTHSV